LGAVVQLVNIRNDTVHGSRATNHADVVQSWAGPRELRIDRLTASSQYQGLFLLPHQFYNGPIGTWDLRNINIIGTAGSGFLLWKESGAAIRFANVYVSKVDGRQDKMMWPNAAAWPGVAMRKTTDFVPAGSAGATYVGCVTTQ
jgi:hypothetical protein